MNKISRYMMTGAVALMAAAALSSCDNVAEDDRFIKLPPIEADRAVLIEDFTGQNCLNCPRAHEKIEELQKQYGADKVIAVSIHGGSMAISDRRPFGLMTQEGDEICNYYSIPSFPMGVIDGVTPPVDDAKWATAVYNDLQKPSEVQLEASAELGVVEELVEGKIEKKQIISCTANINSSEEGQGKIQFWIVESNIVAQQKLPDGSIDQNYVHNNVFRAQVFPMRGNPVTFSRDGVTANGAVDVRERWNLENVEVVAFVSDNNNIVQQVVKVPVKLTPVEQTPAE